MTFPKTADLTKKDQTRRLNDTPYEYSSQRLLAFHQTFSEQGQREGKQRRKEGRMLNEGGRETEEEDEEEQIVLDSRGHTLLAVFVVLTPERCDEKAAKASDPDTQSSLNVMANECIPPMAYKQL